jgi:hypothetical protein
MARATLVDRLAGRRAVLAEKFQATRLVICGRLKELDLLIRGTACWRFNSQDSQVD